MIPDPRRDARTEPSVDDRGSGSVLGFEGDGRAAEPERRVVSRAESDRMLIGVRAVVPLNPEVDRPSAAHRDASGDIVLHSIELPRPTNFPDDVRRAGDRPIIAMPREILHQSGAGESLHVVRQGGITDSESESGGACDRAISSLDASSIRSRWGAR